MPNRVREVLRPPEGSCSGCRLCSASQCALGICCAAVSTLEAVVLGSVQGLTEFIPISSSGHLVVVPSLLGWSKPSLAFDVMLHFASLLALLVYFSGDLVDLARGFVHRDREARRLLFLLAIATVPAGLAGILLGDLFEDQFEDARGAALQLLITAVIIVGAEQALRYHQRRHAQAGTRLRGPHALRTPDALAIGVAQAAAIVPGISRSGATIGTGLAFGIERDVAARFSFLLAIPALFGAALFKLPDFVDSPVGLGAAAGGFLASLATSYGAIWGLIRYLKSKTLYPFAVYCAVAGPTFALLID